MLDPKSDLTEFFDAVERAAVKDQDSWERTASHLREIVLARRQLNEEFDHVIRGAYNAHKEARAHKMQFDTQLETAEKSLREKLSKFSPEKEVEGFDVRKRLVFRVVDEDLIPREYLCVDGREVQRVVDSLGSAADIPGIEVEPKYTVAILGKKHED